MTFEPPLQSPLILHMAQIDYSIGQANILAKADNIVPGKCANLALSEQFANYPLFKGPFLGKCLGI